MTSRSAEIAAYRAGMVNGIRAYAFWKDGEQLVGVMRRPLREVLAMLAAVPDAEIERCLPAQEDR